MSIIKTVSINGENVVLEKRYCLNTRCNAQFWAHKSSNSGICSITCWEIVHDKTWTINKKGHCRLPFYPVDNEEKHEKAIEEAKKRQAKYNSRIEASIKKTLSGK